MIGEVAECEACGWHHDDDADCPNPFPEDWSDDDAEWLNDTLRFRNGRTSAALGELEWAGAGFFSFMGVPHKWGRTEWAIPSPGILCDCEGAEHDLQLCAMKVPIYQAETEAAYLAAVKKASEPMDDDARTTTAPAPPAVSVGSGDGVILPMTKKAKAPAKTAAKAKPARSTADAVDLARRSVALAFVAPERLARHPNQVRTEIGDITGLTADVAANGVIEPLIVEPSDGVDPDVEYWILAGSRRQAAAIASAQTVVPILIRTDMGSKSQRILLGWSENEERKQLELAEKVEAFKQLGLEGFDAATLAAVTRYDRKTVDKMVKVAKSPHASSALHTAPLTLEQAADLASIKDKASVAELVDVAESDPQMFNHRLSQITTAAADAATEKRTRAKLVKAGYQVWAEGEVPEGAQRLHELRTGDNDFLSDDAHSTCPGRAAVINGYNPYRYAEYCADPAGNGHMVPAPRFVADAVVIGGPVAPPKGTPEAKEHRSLVIANNRAWKAATPVRRRWLVEFCARATPPKDLLAWSIAEAGRAALLLHDADDATIGSLINPNGESEKTAIGYRDRVAVAAAVEALTPTRLPFALFALVAASYENAMTAGSDGGVGTWRYKDKGKGRYLAALAAWKYPLSDVESIVAGWATDESAPERSYEMPDLDDSDEGVIGDDDLADADDESTAEQHAKAMEVAAESRAYATEHGPTDDELAAIEAGSGMTGEQIAEAIDSEEF